MLKTILTKAEYDALPDSIPKAEVYGGKFDDGRVRIDAANVDGWTVEDTAGLRAALSKKSAESSQFDGELKAFRALGMQAHEAADLIAKARQMDKWTPEEKAKESRDAAIRDVESKYKAELKAVQERADALERESDTYVRDAKLVSLLAAHAVDPQKVARLMADQVRKVRRDGQVALEVVDANGNPRISMKPGQSGNMGPEELVDQWRADPANAWLWKPAGISGAGTAGSAGPAASAGGLRRIPESAYKDPVRYEAMKAELAKSGVSMDQVEIVRGQ